MHTDHDRHALARARALRAVTAVTLGIFALGAAGCAATVTHDLARPEVGDASSEAATDASDASGGGSGEAAVVADAGVSPDAGEVCERDAGNEAYFACCERNGWNWNLGCQAWGPFVPPSMEAV